ncbi:heme-binding protein 2-like [Cucurbita pepo subsp. pepo]|uniref:heme-binding protein 2-like n=1 Tax=Cucurbita pepo subsp. pepo TaxID=3664 RepID=UPI000C9D770E|nr:heme-binding protein 2-like [Cucurbita pepo subsp. pepo]
MNGKILMNFALTICFFCCCSSGRVIESPHYNVIHVEAEFEIRQYKQVSWISALVQGTASFEKSTQQGFHRLYQYIHGANSNSSHFLITSPVTTTIMASTRGPERLVRYYLPSMYTENPPLPNSELNVQFEKWRSNCLAVRRFSGFAKDDNINKEVEALKSSLNKYLPKSSAISEYTVAQYNSSRHLSGRLNEVWLDVSAVTSEGCQRR